jgi:adenosylcobalamin-dependent ribonucleoside-triphosphate reductase
MDALMLGVGVGFDTRGAGSITIKSPDKTRNPEMYVVPDTREGWVKSLGILLRSYMLGDPQVSFDYRHVRSAGAPIKTFGGKSAGHEPLEKLHEGVRNILGRRVGSRITLTDIVDIQNMIGKAVVAGNVRRSAEIAFGDYNSAEFLDLKNSKVNPDRNDWNSGWAWSSNNSIFADLGMNYDAAAERVRINGEPGFAWLENMRHFGRMADPRNDKDIRVKGGNPCLEQSLESYELCCLVENFPARHKDLQDFLRTLKFSYLYAKSVTLGETHWPETNEVMMRNRRIGCSVTGLAQFLSTRGMDETRAWLDKGYGEIQEWDKIYSDWLAVPRSIKTTSVKPSGTVSLLAGASAGIHYPESRYYLKNMRIAGNHPILKDLDAAGYPIEPSKSDPNTMIVSLPVSFGDNVRTRHEVSMWEQLSNAAALQEVWADNQVSATITFDPKTEGKDIARALDHFQYRLKGVSFLPLLEEGAYPQMPEQKISREEFIRLSAKLKPIKFEHVDGFEADNTAADKYCDGGKCTIPGK